MVTIPKFMTPWRATVFLAIVSTIFIAWLGMTIISRPTGLPGQLRFGYAFSVVAMKGSKPVELYHQCSGYVIERLESLDGKRRTGNEVETTAHRMKAEALVEKPIVWADTGTATGYYRYYLTKADLPKISQLDTGTGANFRKFDIKILKDDPIKKTQTVRVDIWVDDARFASVYDVENNQVTPPLKWNYLRAQSMILTPFVLVGAGCFWGFVIWFAKLIYNRNQYIQKNL